MILNLLLKRQKIDLVTVNGDRPTLMQQKEYDSANKDDRLLDPIHITMERSKSITKSVSNNTQLTPQTPPLILGVSGASGLIYAVRAIKYLLQADKAIELVASKSTYMVWQSEQNIRMPVEPIGQEQFWRQQAGVETLGKLSCHPWGDVGANIASGSFRTLGMIVIPCSMGTVAKLANGLSSDLLERAADVQLKEGRKLVVVPRETPFSLIHLRNLTTLAEAGARIVPAIPAWYHNPQTIEDLVDFVVARTLDQLDIDCIPIERWQGRTAAQ